MRREKSVQNIEVDYLDQEIENEASLIFMNDPDLKILLFRFSRGLMDEEQIKGQLMMLRSISKKQAERIKSLILKRREI